MMDNPSKYIADFAKAGADMISVHYEIDEDLSSLISLIESFDVKPAVAIKPKTPIEVIYPILFFNEADAIFGNRMENTQRSVDKMENALQNIILQEMEVLDGIMICTTNLTSCLDKAFDRRFIYKVEFEKPTNQARKLIWQSMLSSLNDEQATELANRFDFSGGQIQNISRKQVINAIFSGKDELDYDQIKLDCQNESISRNSRGKVGF